MKTESELQYEAKLAQFRILHDRTVLYTSRMWQLPFIYIASTGVTLVKSDGSSPVALVAVTIGFSLFGVLVLRIIQNFMERVSLLIQDIGTMEKELGLMVTVVPQKPMPYYLITCIGLGMNFYVFVSVTFNSEILTTLSEILYGSF